MSNEKAKRERKIKTQRFALCSVCGDGPLQAALLDLTGKRVWLCTDCACAASEAAHRFVEEPTTT